LSLGPGSDRSHDHPLSLWLYPEARPKQPARRRGSTSLAGFLPGTSHVSGQWRADHRTTGGSSREHRSASRPALVLVERTSQYLLNLFATRGGFGAKTELRGKPVALQSFTASGSCVFKGCSGHCANLHGAAAPITAHSAGHQRLQWALRESAWCGSLWWSPALEDAPPLQWALRESAWCNSDLGRRR
jgi:hypothetical protein